MGFHDFILSLQIAQLSDNCKSKYCTVFGLVLLHCNAFGLHTNIHEI